jgi:dTMP kinase
MDMLRTITAFATGGLEPDLTLYLDIDPEEGLQRRQIGGEEWNRLDAETLEFHQRVRDGYLRLIEESPHRWIVIDAARSIGKVWEAIKEQVQTKLTQRVQNG